MDNGDDLKYSMASSHTVFYLLQFLEQLQWPVITEMRRKYQNIQKKMRQCHSSALLLSLKVFLATAQHCPNIVYSLVILQ